MKTAIVLGGADCVFSDYLAAKAMFTPDVTLAVNHIGRDFSGPLDCFCSTHSENLRGWIDERATKGFPTPAEIWMNDTRKVPPELQNFIVRRTSNIGGSSSHLAIMAAVDKGCDRIVVCGVPLDASPHYNDPAPWHQYAIFQQTWLRDKAFLKQYVRSMSGWSRDLLGAPTLEWLQGRE